MYFAWLLLVAILAGGCASYSDIKNMPVNRRYHVSGVSAESLSACIRERLQEEGGFPLYRNFDLRRRAWIVAAAIDASNYSYSLSIFGDTPRNITVELRSLRTVWGTLQAPEEKIAKNLRECENLITP